MCWYNRNDFIMSMPFAVQLITIFKLLEPLRKGIYTIREKKVCYHYKNILKEKYLRIMIPSAISSMFYETSVEKIIYNIR